MVWVGLGGFVVVDLHGLVVLEWRDFLWILEVKIGLEEE